MFEDDLKFDAAALYAHLRDIGDEPEAPFLWSFGFSSPIADELEAVVEDLGEIAVETLAISSENIAFELAESVNFIDEDGYESTGPPYLSLEFTGVLTESELQNLHERFQEQCLHTPVTYDGVSYYTLPDDDGWDEAE